MLTRAVLVSLLALGACAPRQEPFFQPRPGAPETNPAVAAACREQAQQIIARQDRSQLMREDERDSRLGAEVTPFTLRTQTDRLGRGFQYDRLVNECIRRNVEAGAPARQAAQPERAPEPDPIPESTRTRRRGN
jgi:hypothetical protein